MPVKRLVRFRHCLHGPQAWHNASLGARATTRGKENIALPRFSGSRSVFGAAAPAAEATPRPGPASARVHNRTSLSHSSILTTAERRGGGNVQCSRRAARERERGPPLSAIPPPRCAGLLALLLDLHQHKWPLQGFFGVTDLVRTICCERMCPLMPPCIARRAGRAGRWPRRRQRHAGLRRGPGGANMQRPAVRALRAARAQTTRQTMCRSGLLLSSRSRSQGDTAPPA